MIKLYFATIAFAFAGVFSLTAQGQISVKEGDTFACELRSTAEMQQSGMGMDFTLTTDNFSSFTTKITGVSEFVDAEIRYDSLSMTSRGAAMMGLPDTTVGSAQKKLFGFNQKANRRGRVVLNEAFGTPLPPFDQLGQMSGIALLSQAELFFFELPEQPLAEGRRWTTNAERTVGTTVGDALVKGALNFEVLRKVDTLGTTCWVVKTTSQDMTIAMNTETEMGETKATGEVDSETMYWIDSKSGLPLTYTQESETMLNLSVAGQMQGIFTITVTNKSVFNQRKVTGR